MKRYVIWWYSLRLMIPVCYGDKGIMVTRADTVCGKFSSVQIVTGTA